MASLKDLPEELNSNILECLLPQMTYCPLNEEYTLQETRDLFRVRAVCRGLCRLASPLAWRRLYFRIRATDLLGQGQFTSAPNPHLPYSFAASGVVAPYPSRAQAGYPVLLNPLNPYVPSLFDHLDHQDLVSHTRFLILDLHDWDSDNYALSQCAGRIAGSLNSFISLCVIFLHCRAQHTPPTFLSVFMQLPQPNLALHINECEIEPSGHPPPVSTVKYLQFTGSSGVLPSIAQARSLTHLWLERCPDHDSAASQLPWRTLVSVGLRDCPSQFWGPFFAGFSKFRQAGNIAPLTELNIGGTRTPLSPTLVPIILQIFGCQQLTKLDLDLGDDPSPSQTLSQIASTFPTLQSLTLLSNEYLGGWPGDPIQSLRSLSSLRYLCWNNVDRWEPKRDLDILPIDDRDTFLYNTTEPLASALPNLQEITFVATSTGFSKTCIITYLPKHSLDIVGGSLEFLDPDWLFNHQI